jgi:ParB-like chromosome segregation protein Spo0J
MSATEAAPAKRKRKTRTKGTTKILEILLVDINSGVISRNAIPKLGRDWRVFPEEGYKSLYELFASDDPDKWAECKALIERQKDIVDLSVSISMNSLLHPISIFKTEDGYCLGAGHRRFLAHVYKRLELAGATHPHDGVIQAVIKEPVSDVLFEQDPYHYWYALSVVENLQRNNPDPFDEADQIKQLKNFGFKNVEIAKALSVSESLVQKRLKLNTLSKPVRDKYRQGEITLGQALAMVKKPDDDNTGSSNDITAGPSAAKKAFKKLTKMVESIKKIDVADLGLDEEIASELRVLRDAAETAVISIALILERVTTVEESEDENDNMD